MNTQELIPNEGLEYKLLAYALEHHMMTGEILEFNFLYHQKVIASFKKIGTGAPLFEIMPLDDCFCTKAEAENSVIPKLKELKSRRDEYQNLQSQLKNVFDPAVDYSTPSTDRTLENGLEQAQDSMKGNPKGIETGVYQPFESVIGGIRAGQLFGICGESESGKTTLALNYIDKLISNNDIKVLVISLEMGEDEFLETIAQMRLKKSRRHLVWSVNNDNLVLKDEMAKGVFGNWKNAVFNYSARSMKEIEQAISRNKPNIVMIDHMQYIQMDEKNLAIHMNKICNDWKQFAKKYAFGGILLSQIDKSASKTHMVKGEEIKKKPRLVDAWGGNAFKNALDFGTVIQRSPESSIVYWDKVRKPWEYEHRYTDFEVYIKPELGDIYALMPRSY